MNPSTLIFLGLAVVWAVVLLPEVFRKLSEQGSLSPDMLKALTGALDDVRGSH